MQLTHYIILGVFFEFCFAFLAFLVGNTTAVRTPEPARAHQHLLRFHAHPNFNISAGYVIALNPRAQDARKLVNDTRHWLGVRRTIAWRATNASDILRASSLFESKLPLYTRMAMSSGRHDHMALGSLPMLGCLLSHMRVWTHFLARHGGDDDILLVLEEDASIDAVSAERLTTLLQDDMPGEPRWDILLLEQGHITVSGPTRRFGQLGATWALPSPSAERGIRIPADQTLHWMGTRGYLLRASAARLLLTHAREFTVQVDALIGLVAAFYPSSFRMYWTRSDIAHQGRLAIFSTLQDRCIKCFFPVNGITYVFLLFGIVGSIMIGVALVMHRFARQTAVFKAQV